MWYTGTIVFDTDQVRHTVALSSEASFVNPHQAEDGAWYEALLWMSLMKKHMFMYI